MKRTLLVIGLVLVLVLLVVGAAMAAGYNAYESGSLYTTNPHGAYSTGSNKCKTCHAVHKAGETWPTSTAWKLLRATSQTDACNFCHVGASAHTGEVPYGAADPTTVTIGHTIGVNLSTIPDTQSVSASGTFTCYSCHTVHGAKAITFNSVASKILKNDPLASGSAVANDASAYNAATSASVKNYCLKCHDANIDTGYTGGTPNTEKSHPLTTASGVKAFSGSQTCLTCHDKDLAANNTGSPHTSSSFRMLRGTGDVVSTALDNNCIACHVSGSTGVGLTF